jgi:hypothetical protein
MVSLAGGLSLPASEYALYGCLWLSIHVKTCNIGTAWMLVLTSRSPIAFSCAVEAISRLIEAAM